MKQQKQGVTITLVALFCLVCWAGCKQQGERCAKCGMVVDDAPRWVAGLTNGAGKPQRFCSPRCMFAWSKGPAGKGSEGAWVTEYYSQKKLPVGKVLFVMGSDVVGPMGKALVPIAGKKAAEQFRKDHNGQRLLSADDITIDRLKSLKKMK